MGWRPYKRAMAPAKAARRRPAWLVKASLPADPVDPPNTLVEVGWTSFAFGPTPEAEGEVEEERVDAMTRVGADVGIDDAADGVASKAVLEDAAASAAAASANT